MTSYADLGIRPVINAAAQLTRLGGSLMPEPVIAAMAAAAHQFVDMEELERAVSARIAALTRNEACTVTAGAAAGLVVSAAACMTRGDVAAIRRLPDTTGLRNEIVVFRTQRVGYDQALRVAGARLVEVGNMVPGPLPEELAAAINERTAAVCFFAGLHLASGSLPLAQVVAVAHAAGVPVIVDAAAQLPPVENLWRFTDLGADLVVFSGGKSLCGPQSAGLVLGRRQWVEYARQANAPRYGPARPAKVSKEELMGMLAAVEWYMSLDHAAIHAGWEAQVRRMVEGLQGLPGVIAERVPLNEAGQPVPRAAVRFGPGCALRTEQVVAALRSGNPVIEVLATELGDGIYLNPMTLKPGEEQLIVARLREILENPPRD